MTNCAIRNRVPSRRLHVNLLTQLTIEKCVLNIKLRHRPVANRGHSKKSAHSGHMDHWGKGLIIVMALLLLEATSHKTRFVALKRSIRAGLNLVDPLACDETNTGRRRDKIPSASAQAQQSPRPWQAAIRDDAQHPDKKSAQGQQKDHTD
jgi:hypothetical protein